MSSGPEVTRRGFTLFEIMMTLAIIATLSTMGFVRYRHSVAEAERVVAERELQVIMQACYRYEELQGTFPATLDDLGMGELNDPWGNPFRYLGFQDTEAAGKKRKDRFLVPINTDFDLYSMGPDGKSDPELTAATSLDDIIAANDGGYIGKASDY